MSLMLSLDLQNHLLNKIYKMKQCDKSRMYEQQVAGLIQLLQAAEYGPVMAMERLLSRRSQMYCPLENCTRARR